MFPWTTEEAATGFQQQRNHHPVFPENGHVGWPPHHSLPLWVLPIKWSTGILGILLIHASFTFLHLNHPICPSHLLRLPHLYLAHHHCPFFLKTTVLSHLNSCNCLPMGFPGFTHASQALLSPSSQRHILKKANPSTLTHHPGFKIC